MIFKNNQIFNIFFFIYDRLNLNIAVLSKEIVGELEAVLDFNERVNNIILLINFKIISP